MEGVVINGTPVTRSSLGVTLAWGGGQDADGRVGQGKGPLCLRDLRQPRCHQQGRRRQHLHLPAPTVCPAGTEPPPTLELWVPPQPRDHRHPLVYRGRNGGSERVSPGGSMGARGGSHVRGSPPGKIAQRRHRGRGEGSRCDGPCCGETAAHTLATGPGPATTNSVASGKILILL